jgi:hypothetical protein
MLGFDFPISAMSRDDGAVGDPSPSVIPRPPEFRNAERRQARNPENVLRNHAVSGNFFDALFV